MDKTTDDLLAWIDELEEEGSTHYGKELLGKAVWLIEFLWEEERKQGAEIERLRNLITEWCDAADMAGAQGAQGVQVNALRRAVGR